LNDNENCENEKYENDEKHICPLQLDTIGRCLVLWSNPEDVVLDPFNGIGSSGYQSLILNRKYIGIELKKDPKYLSDLLACEKRDTKSTGEKKVTKLKSESGTSSGTVKKIDDYDLGLSWLRCKDLDLPLKFWLELLVPAAHMMDHPKKVLDSLCGCISRLVSVCRMEHLHNHSI
jgi:hypothetical protein